MGVPKSWLLSQVSKPHMQGFLALCTAHCTLQVHIYIHFDQYEKCAQKMFTVYYNFSGSIFLLWMLLLQDKILQSFSKNEEIQVTNDGATILKSIGVDNPAAKILVGK